MAIIVALAWWCAWLPLRVALTSPAPRMIASCSEVAGWLSPHRWGDLVDRQADAVGEQRHDPLTAVAGQSFDERSGRVIQDRRLGRGFPCHHGTIVSAASDMYGMSARERRQVPSRTPQAPALSSARRPRPSAPVEVNVPTLSRIASRSARDSTPVQVATTSRAGTLTASGSSSAAWSSTSLDSTTAG